MKYFIFLTVIVVGVSGIIYLVKGGGGPTEDLVVDTGADPAPLLQAARDHRLQVTHIFNTHFHADHTQYNRDIATATADPLEEPPGIRR